ncbi:MAG TPA: HTH domain-containing protein [Trueperaceae bacterium]
MADTRRQLMQKLLEYKPAGLTIGELSDELGITRTAVQQHIVGLERDGLVAPVESRSTGGRPSRSYGLTDRGYEGFPRNYALLAQGLLETAAEALGEEGVERLLGQMAERIADGVGDRSFPPGSAERLHAVLGVMNELGYEATALPEEEGIAAANCVYHKLARQTRAVCRYDVKLLSLLMGRPVAHTGCMLDGRSRCTFALVEEGQADE